MHHGHPAAPKHLIAGSPALFSSSPAGCAAGPALLLLVPPVGRAHPLELLRQSPASSGHWCPDAAPCHDMACAPDKGRSRRQAEVTAWLERSQ